MAWEADMEVEEKTCEAVGMGWLHAVARGVGLFVGGFSLLNLLGEAVIPGFNANEWWIDWRPWPWWVGDVLLLVGGILLMAWVFRPTMAKERRVVTRLIVLALLITVVANVVTFYVLVGRGVIRAGVPVPFSLLVGVALGLIGWVMRSEGSLGVGRWAFGVRGWVVMLLVVGMCVVGFPLAQMLCYGKTDYRRRADAIVVFGARTYADGRMSDALQDRVITGCRLYQQGWAPRMIMSGGPGDGAVHETEAMRQMAIRQGVPAEAIWVDRQGLNTEATVRNTMQMGKELGLIRMLAVSHFYHLPRVKMAYQRAGGEVYTVPAECERTLVALPKYMAREVVALWWYYLGPLGGEKD